MNATDQAFILHRRPYRETSALVRFWCAQSGLITAVVKGVHGRQPDARLAQRNAWLQPFQLLDITMRGQSELKQVYNFEPADPPNRLTGQSLLAGQYLNQMLVEVLSQYEADEQLFDQYRQLLSTMESQTNNFSNRALAVELRYFEQALLTAVGFGIDWTHDLADQPIQDNRGYSFNPGAGFELFGQIQGQLILGIANAQWQVPGALSLTRWVLRQQLEWCLNKPVPSVQGTD